MRILNDLIDTVKRFFRPTALAAAVGLGASVFTAHADLPAVAVAPRNSTLTSLTLVTNAQVLTINSPTNLLLTAAYQHDISCTTLVTATNAVVGGTNTLGSGAATYTNYFDLAKITGTSGNYVTNWTTDQPITVTGTLNGLAGVVQARIINHTNFDGYELIRLSKTGHGATNNYSYTVILGQTP